MQTSYNVLFDVTQAPNPDLGGPLRVGFLLLFAAVFLWMLSQVLRRKIPWIIVTVVGTMGALLIVGPLVTRWQFHQFIETYRAGRYEVTEGIIEQFKPMPLSGHGLESFEVGGKRFAYSDFRQVPGFHQTRLYRGRIHAGLYVRIYYIGDHIARLEIRHNEVRQPEKS